MMKSVVLVLACFFLSSCAGLFDCWIEDRIGKYEFERCHISNRTSVINYFSPKRAFLAPRVNNTLIKKYSSNNNDIYIYMSPKSTAIKKAFNNEFGEYDLLIDEKLRDLPFEHPDRMSEYAKINHQTGEVWYFRKKAEMSDEDKKIYEKLEKAYELEQEGKWQRKNNFHTEWPWIKQTWMKFWNPKFYEYPPEKVDFIELTEIE